MTQVGMFEAKTHFSELAKRVKAGEEITVTNRGEPVLVMVPVKSRPTSEEVRAMVEKWQSEARTNPGPQLTIEEIIAIKHEGHKN